MLFRFENVEIGFGGHCLFDGVNVQCNPGDRIGLIGRNGCGKTILLDLIEGLLSPDKGEVYRANKLEISRVEQIPQFDSGLTVREETLKVFEYLRSMERRLQALQAEISGPQKSVPGPIAEEYETLSFQLRFHGGYNYQARTEAILMGLGFSREAVDGSCTQLSGGQRGLLSLAKALLRDVDLLLLDEPTNHLDIQGILWLTEYLQAQKVPFVLISHDRYFLNEVTRQTWEIERGQLHDYPGNFARTRQLRQERLTLQEKEYRRQKEWKAKTEDFIRRNIAGQKTKQAQSRRKKLERVKLLVKPIPDEEKLKIHITESRRAGSMAFTLERGEIGYPGTPLIEGVSLNLSRGDRIGILGGNGSGKSTFLKTLVGEIPLLNGMLEWGPNNDPACLSQNPILGDGHQSVYDCLRELDRSCTDFELRSFAARFLFNEEDMNKKVEQLSGGERSRLALARFFYHPVNVLILDEPTNHLDIQSREAVEETLSNYDGTLIVVSHDLFFLKRTVDQFYLIQDCRLVSIDGSEHLSQQHKIKFRPRIRRKPGVDFKGRVSSSKPVDILSKNEQRRRQEKLLELEARIEGLEARREEIVRALQQRYTDFIQVHELSDQHGQIEEELKILYEEWEGVTGELTSGHS